MRLEAYYHAYGFHIFHTQSRIIKPIPYDSDALAFSYGLILLNGIPASPPPSITKNQVLNQLSYFTNKRYSFITAQSSDGHKVLCLSLSEDENKKVIMQFENYARISQSRKLDINRGTEEHPFENIDEAIEYIESCERDAVEHDEFLNSQFNKDIYRYDIGALISSGCMNFTGLFKISWASAFTAHTNNSFPKNAFIVTQLTPSNNDWEWLQEDAPRRRGIPLFALKPNLSKRRFLFRGQNEEFKDKRTSLPICRPNLYRPDVEENLLPHRIKAYEMACLVTRHPLVQQLGIKGVTIFNEPFRFQLNLLGLAQHYYNKTSFLDLTSDIQVAKFFACCKYDWNNDSYIPYHSDQKLGILYIYDMRLPYEFKSSELPQLSSIGKQYVFLRSAMQSGFLLNMPEGVDLHMLPNVYRIYFKHNQAISKDIAQKTAYGDMYFPKDALSMYWKKMYKAPNSDYSISLKARKMYLTLHPADFSSRNELDKALTHEGFRLGTNRWPEFPQTILDDYYANAEELWAKFCSDIYFLGFEGFFMKKALEELILNDRYKDAFFK